ncbi:MAG TPA: hypothetical protein VJ814_11940 [Gaiellaceae bacterium]|nr:hypothetical protein [Gaiellaceae bacterium]
MRHAFRYVNVLIAAATLASALAVLASDLAVAGYREHYRDAVWFVVLYAAIQLVVLIEFARGGALVPWLALAKALAAWVFLANFLVLWPRWQTWTPARYVYQLFEWGEGGKLGLFALVFLGRGAFNTVNAAYFTAPWWMPLRTRRPLLGRLVTALPIGATVLFVWLFIQLTAQEAKTFSPEAAEIARLVLDGVDCDAVRAHRGETTTDVRQRGERRYDVAIAYDCALTRVVVRAADGRIGVASAPQLACCAEPAS